MAKNTQKAGINDESSQEGLHELKQRAEDLKDPVRFVICYKIDQHGSTADYYLNISDSTFSEKLSCATLIKNQNVTEAIAEAYSEGRQLYIAKVIVENDELRVVQCKIEQPQNSRLEGTVLHYENPTKPVALGDWDSFFEAGTATDDFMNDR